MMRDYLTEIAYNNQLGPKQHYRFGGKDVMAYCIVMYIIPGSNSVDNQYRLWLHADDYLNAYGPDKGIVEQMVVITLATPIFGDSTSYAFKGQLEEFLDPHIFGAWLARIRRTVFNMEWWLDVDKTCSGHHSLLGYYYIEDMPGMDVRSTLYG